MSSEKLVQNLKVAIIVPCYKRPEYTIRCLKSIEDAQEYSPNVKFYLVDDGSKNNTLDYFTKFKLRKTIISHNENQGLRNVLIEFFDRVKEFNPHVIAKIDNDVLVPKNWLNDLLEIRRKSFVQILSPNVFPSNAAYKYGQPDNGLGYRPSKIVGGLWLMDYDLLDNMFFERHDVYGIKGAFNILKQIIVERTPAIGWAENVTCQDLGHWSGKHPDSIKTAEHELYYQEVGRKVGW